jgi:hypothetical protein
MSKTKIITVLLLRIFLFVFSFLSLSLLLNSSLSQVGRWWAIVCSVCNLITLFVIFKLTRSQNITYKQLINYHQYQSSYRAILIGVIVILVIGMGGMFFAGYIVYGEFPYLAKDLIEPLPVWLAILNIFILPLSTTLAEDGLYLGIGVNQLSNRWIGLLIPALLYALQHSFIPLYFDMYYMLYRFLSFLPLTLLICLWYQKNHNPVPIMVGHFIINLATVVQILIMSSNPEIFYSLVILV